MPTAQTSLECLIFAASGWIAGRLNRTAPLATALAFAGTLCLYGVSGTLPVDVPWLFRLTLDALRDSRYLDSLATTASVNLLLFGCLIAGGWLSRPRTPSIGMGLLENRRA